MYLFLVPSRSSGMTYVLVYLLGRAVVPSHAYAHVVIRVAAGMRNAVVSH